MAERVGIYPGTFDPITNGHMDVISRGARVVEAPRLLHHQEMIEAADLVVVAPDLPDHAVGRTRADRVVYVNGVDGIEPSVVNQGVLNRVGRVGAVTLA